MSFGVLPSFGLSGLLINSSDVVVKRLREGTLTEPVHYFSPSRDGSPDSPAFISCPLNGIVVGS